MKKLIWVTYCLLSLQVLYAGTLVEQKLNWQGFERGYLLYVPDSYNPQIPAPLLFDLHGGGGTAANTIKLTFGGFNKLADKHGFLVVYPNGLGKQWNDGRVDILKEQFQDVDDVGFILEIVSRIKKPTPSTPSASLPRACPMAVLCPRACYAMLPTYFGRVPLLPQPFPKPTFPSAIPPNPLGYW